VPLGSLLGQSPAKTDLQIVWMWAEREEIDLLGHYFVRAGPHPGSHARLPRMGARPRALPSLTLRILRRPAICLVIIIL
jgi:hypothetical protein